jgi:hypothetical protein
MCGNWAIFTCKSNCQRKVWRIPKLYSLHMKFHFQCSQSFWWGPNLDKIQNIKYVILKFLLKAFQHHVKFFNCVFQIQLWMGKTLIPSLNSNFKILICGYSCGEIKDCTFFYSQGFPLYLGVCYILNDPYHVWNRCLASFTINPPSKFSIKRDIAFKNRSFACKPLMVSFPYQFNDILNKLYLNSF